MSELTSDADQIADEERAAPKRQRIRRLPPGKLDVIYIGGFPPFWKIWRKGGMMTIDPELRESHPER